MHRRRRASENTSKHKVNRPNLRCSLKIMKHNIKLANSENNLTQIVNSLSLFTSKKNHCFQLSCISVAECPPELFKWMMDLLESNMSDLYSNCEWGWNVKEKHKEMSEANARFVVAYTQDLVPIAFSHFRFDMDNDVSVVYCYELQLDKASRKLGLGKHMLCVLESLGKHFQMSKVVLTVFNSNQRAFDFFVSQGYTIDESSPQNFSLETFYSILSKSL